MVLSASGRRLVFQPTLPARGATQPAPRDLLIRLDFNPRSPRGERPDGQRIHAAFQRFQPTLPARGATDVGAREHRHNAFQPTLPARGATHAVDVLLLPGAISTHAPREGSDQGPALHRRRGCNFNPRSPRGERPTRSTFSFFPALFQPTLPARGATILPPIHLPHAHYFNPRSPRGERPWAATASVQTLPHFNPRSPRGERRSAGRWARSNTRYFNPRSPRGERPHGLDSFSSFRTFQPTLPARGATPFVQFVGRGGCRFQPTLPARGATKPTAEEQRQIDISTHAPREGSDSGTPSSVASPKRFQPTLPARGATANISKFSKAELSNIAKLCIELQQKLLCFPFKSVFSPLNLPPSPHFSVRTSRRTSARLSFAPHNIKGSSGMYVCLQPKCSILFSYRLPR